LIKGRLKFLGTAGLAQESPPGLYTLSEGYQETLSQMGTRNDVMKRLHNKIDTGLEGLSIYTLKAGEGPTVEGQLVTKGVEDELYDRKYIVIREPAGQLHYVPINNLREFDDLEQGSLIKVRPGEAGTGKADYNIATIAAANEGVYDPALHQAHIEQHQKYIRVEERPKYLEAHAQRLETLEKNGVVEALGAGHYKVPPDVVARGEEITRQINEKERKRFYPLVSVLSTLPPEKQIEAAKKTWMDKELYKQESGKGVSALLEDAAIRGAFAARKNWLVKHDLALIQSNGEFALRDYALKRLDKFEIYAAGQKLAERLGATFNDAQVKSDMVMRYEGFVSLETGIWAAVTRGKNLQLAAVRAEPALDRGAAVIFEQGADKALTIRSMAKDQSKVLDKEQGRGL
ncbi:MAG: DUF3363 domain-containing protein, partial [Alphaproteobacteria bacterium]|nr:DUF3363 domain-containing protein [Alphaproteobacteria bacterium]